MKLSIVVPVLNEEANVSSLARRVADEMAGLTDDFEILFVDDGSTDASAERIAALRRGDPRIKLIRLSRNFGHQIALTAGLDHASGDAVIVMDADLQHPPETIRALVERWKSGFDVVYTVREKTQDSSLAKRWSSALFYRIFRFLSRVDLPPDAADFRLYDRKVVEAFRGIRERTRFLRGLTQWVGYRSSAVPYRAPARQEGDSKYTLRRMLRFARDGLVSFSVAPLYLAIYVGVALAVAGFGYCFYVLYARFISGKVVPGWTSLIMLFAIVGGIQLILMGVIGIYIGTIYEEVKQRPLYLVREAHGVGGDAPSPPRPT